MRRWRRRDSFSGTFCSRSYNGFGSYLSLINVRGRRRAVLIIPEITFSAGGIFVTDKIGHTLKTWVNHIDVADHRLVGKELPFADAVRNIKWSNKEATNSSTFRKGEVIHFKENLDPSQNELFNRCLVGSLSVSIAESPLCPTSRR